MPLSPVPSVAGSFTDRAGLPRRVLRWEGRRPFIGMLILHTFGSHAARYERVAGDIALSGVTVEAVDFPGHGTTPGERGAASWSSLLDTLEDRLAALRADLPGLPVAVYGHGLGGLVAVDYLQEGRRPPPDLLLLVAPSLTFVEPMPD